MTRIGAFAAVAAISMLASAAHAQTPPQAPTRVRGIIASINGDTLEIQPRRGDKVVARLGDKTFIGSVVHAQLADLQPGRFIGTAAVPQPDGTLKALEVHAFPETMRGTGEGHYGWDLNEGSTMTNGSVGSLVGAAGRSLTVTYNGGTKTVVIPEDVPVVDLRPSDRSVLRPGAHVFAVGPLAADGSVTLLRIYAGENGAVPPM